jgi:hypothetical protein
LAPLLSRFCIELQGEVPVKYETSVLVDGCCRFSFEGFVVNMRNHSGFLLEKEKRERILLFLSHTENSKLHPKSSHIFMW